MGHIAWTIAALTLGLIALKGTVCSSLPLLCTDLSQVERRESKLSWS